VRIQRDDVALAKYCIKNKKSIVFVDKKLLLSMQQHRFLRARSIGEEL
jgi:hypothetical protein